MAEEYLIGRGMSARAFEAATPREIQWRIEAVDRQRDLEWMQTAQLATWVLQSFGAKVTAHKLLGKPEPFDLKSFIGE